MKNKLQKPGQIDRSPFELYRTMKKLIFLIVLMATAAVSQAVEVRNLRCEGLVAPSGIDNPNPQLSWMMTEGTDPMGLSRDQRQTAYQVLVSSSEKKLAAGEGDLWNGTKLKKTNGWETIDLGEVQLHQGDNSIRINTHYDVNLKIDYFILEPITK